MDLNSIFKIFLPKDRVFFQLFEEVAEHVNQMGAKLKEMVSEADADKRAGLLSQIENLEHTNDELTHQIFTELGRNFITPFDREDIHYLATSLDDVADYIYASAKKINFYKINPNDTGIHKLTELIQQGTIEAKKAVIELDKENDNLREMLSSMNNYADSLENEINHINNYFIICENKELTIEKMICKSVSELEIIDFDAINNSTIFIPESIPSLHAFATYSQFYLKE